MHLFIFDARVIKHFNLVFSAVDAAAAVNGHVSGFLGASFLLKVPLKAPMCEV